MFAGHRSFLVGGSVGWWVGIGIGIGIGIDRGVCGVGDYANAAIMTLYEAEDTAVQISAHTVREQIEVEEMTRLYAQPVTSCRRCSPEARAQEEI